MTETLNTEDLLMRTPTSSKSLGVQLPTSNHTHSKQDPGNVAGLGQAYLSFSGY